jgi:peptidoglycan/xylan/chitin deacetylase (PgdA/CDA1 family)
MYHRVAELAVDPWSYAVSPQRFALQLELLKSERQIVPMAWLAQRLRDGKSPRNVAAITFDDGYADVYHSALPILQQQSCPATVFITTDAISDASVFWWDVLAGILLETAQLPELLDIETDKQRFEWRLRADKVQLQNSNAVSRLELHAALHGILKSMNPSQRHKIIEVLGDWAQTSPKPRPRDRAMTALELLNLSNADGMEIGAHTCSHPSLPLLDSFNITREISECLRECQRMTGQVASGLAYPYGDLNDITVQIAKSAGLVYAVTASGREIGPWTNPWRIPRVLAANWDEAEFRRKVLSHG